MRKVQTVRGNVDKEMFFVPEDSKKENWAQIYY